MRGCGNDGDGWIYGSWCGNDVGGSGMMGVGAGMTETEAGMTGAICGNGSDGAARSEGVDKSTAILIYINASKA